MERKKRKLLVISYFYAPKREIASIRWSKLVKYMTAKSWEIDIITTSAVNKVDSLLAGEIDRLGNIIFIDHKDKRFAPSEQQKAMLSQILSGKYANTSGSLTNKASIPIKKRTGFAAVKHFIGMSAPMQYIGKRATVQNDLKMSKDFARQVEKFISENGGLEKYDAVVSTYGPVGDVLLALRLKKMYPDIPLIMDFRDPMDGASFYKSYRRKMRKLQKRVCGCADAVCAVTAGLAAGIAPCSPSDITVITNGFDRDDAAGIEPFETDKFTLCYTGSVYTDLDDFSPLWKCLKELSDSGKIDLSRVSFVHAGSNGEYFRNEMSRYGLEGILEDKGIIDRRDSVRLQKSSDGLVIAIWNTKSSQGVLSGKLLEYMLAEKPMIGLVNGELGGSDLRSVVENAKLGVVYEAATGDKDSVRLSEYIYKLYNEKINGIPAGFSPDKNVVDRFDYRVLAENYMELIDTVCKK